jgi:N-acetylglucosaminyldiphosphoundecaprenol N-acetyl-beta-D-mannosaminyltransferase
MNQTQVLKTCLDQVSYASTVDRIRTWTYSLESSYACFANVHLLMEAYDSPDFRQVVNEADLVTPDGMPLVWMMRWKGATGQERVYGPTLMLYVLEAAAKENIPVGFYGGAPEVLEALIQRMQARYPGLNVVFSQSPPFRELNPAEDVEVIGQINHSGTRILFVGLGCPKQEIWMAAHRGKVQAVMLGVGAAFDFHAGLKPQAPRWMQTVGLEWLFRLWTEPRRLWKRYLFHNPRFIMLAVADLLGLLKVE